jgi:hypothetical protein
VIATVEFSPARGAALPGRTKMDRRKIIPLGLRRSLSLQPEFQLPPLMLA